MNCIIVDDEPLAREGIKINVDEVAYLSLIGEFRNAIEANDFLQNNEVDLMFLDIQMPGITGIEFLDSLKTPPLVIMTTAYHEYALKGFELNVVDYLLKPIRLNRFVKASNRAYEIFKTTKQPSNPSKIEEVDFFYVTADRKYLRLFFKDIIYIKGMKDYIILHTSTGKVITAMNLKTVLKQLPASLFARVNKSFIINVQCIQEVESDFIVMSGKIEIPLGRSYKESFINNFIRKNLLKR